jgi:hypothetical protein
MAQSLNVGKKHPCPCCGYLTIHGLGHYEICPVCYWEDDPTQSKDDRYCGGANIISLREARKNFEEFGACSKELIINTRTPYEEEHSM